MLKKALKINIHDFAGRWNVFFIREGKGFTLLEVIIALTILGFGLLALMRAFPIGVNSSQRVADRTRATFLAQSIMEGIKTAKSGFPIIPGSYEIISLPGNGIDDDKFLDVIAGKWDPEINPDFDMNKNGTADIDVDVDYYPPEDLKENMFAQRNGEDDDSDGIVDDPDANHDFDVFYDPEHNVDNAIYSYNNKIYTFVNQSYNELSNGMDDDGDGYIDEDLGLGNEKDEDGDGLYNEEIADNKDNDGDGLTDEDLAVTYYPFYPWPFGMPLRTGDNYKFDPGDPNSDMSWQIIVGKVSDGGGDLIDNDGDGYTDEERKDGVDFNFITNRADGGVDEDCMAAAVPNLRAVTVRILWGGDRLDDDGDGFTDEEVEDEKDNDGDGRTDEDISEFEYRLSSFVVVDGGSQ